MNHLQIEKKFQTIKSSKPNENCLFLESFRDPIWIAKRDPDELFIVFLVKKTFNEEESRTFGNLEFEVLRNCEIIFKNKKERKDIALITLSEPSLKKSFFLFLESFSYVKNSTRFSKIDEITKYIEDWQELFIGNSSLSYEEQVGLWGELYFINQYLYPAKVIEKWHGPDQKLFDFFSGKILLDVKTSNQGTAHYFNLNQVKNEHPVYIYALEITEELTGSSIKELIASIQKKIANKALFFEKLAKTKILNIQPISTKFIPIQKRIIAGRNIPQPRKIDIGVEAVRFKSETSGSKIEGKQRAKEVLGSFSR